MIAFANEPALELRRAPVREDLLEALHELDGRLPVRVPVWVGAERREGEELRSSDPGAPSRAVAVAAEARADEVDRAVAAAAEVQPAWAERPAEERAGVLVRAAEALRARRLALAALQVRECAKPWAEADADVCEAIDFLEYYAREALRIAAGRDLLQVPGERNAMGYAPRGVAAVIAPWNFPLAIPCGMTAAALAVGNAAVLKPAEQSPGTALALVEALHEAGLPPAVLALLPGHGEVGQRLVRHPGVHAIAFTGSREVGLEIVRAAAEVPHGQHHLKRVVAEMGGKNCVIVDADADLDEAVPAVARSAFDYAGQKCSAASRIIVHEAVAGALAARLAGAVEALETGSAADFGVDVPPLIERAARERVEGYESQAGRVLARGRAAPASAKDGWFRAPVLIGDLEPGSPVLEEEVFGPLLTIESAPSVEMACERVEALPYALTAGLFSRSPPTVEAVVRRLPVGNLYVNRGITGAMVGRQPFGGNRLSGVGSKAGGPDYLLQFVEPRVVCENTVRHGLVAG